METKTKGLWHFHNNPNLNKDIFLPLSEKIQTLEVQRYLEMPNLWSGNEIFIVSDYSASHKSFNYEVFSFVFINSQRIHIWGKERRIFRNNYLTNGSRMKFSDLLSNGPKIRALQPFLNLTNWLTGITVTFAIHKSCHFNYNATLFSDLWKAPVYRSLLTVLNLIGFFVGGLSQNGQKIGWISDNDAILSNNTQLSAAIEILRQLIANYSPHIINEIVVATASDDDTGTGAIEDLLSIPDLTAGSIAEYLTTCDEVIPVNERITSFQIPTNLTDRTKTILTWLSLSKQPMKRLIIAIVPHDEKVTLFASQIIKFVAYQN